MVAAFRTETANDLRKGWRGGLPLIRINVSDT